MAMTKRQWEALALLLVEASDAIVATYKDNEEGEQDDDAGTLMSACEVAEKYARQS